MTELCPKCGHLEAYSEEKQLRSADEGTTILYTVGHRFTLRRQKVNRLCLVVCQVQIRMEGQQLAQLAVPFTSDIDLREHVFACPPGARCQGHKRVIQLILRLDECQGAQIRSSILKQMGQVFFIRIPRQHRTWLPFRNRQVRLRGLLPSIP